MSVPAILLEDVGFGWAEGRLALQGCHLRVPQGEFWMLLGANGSGKSTLLKLLAGLITPTQGRVALAGAVGLVLQNPDHQVIMPSVGADVAFGLADLPPVLWAGQVEQALRLVGLWELHQRPVYALSGGQKQRLAIAGALARQVPVLLLDEPTAFLDPAQQLELAQQVQNLVRSTGITALWVTHRLEELSYCDQAVLLAGGRITQQGTGAQLQRYIHQHHLDTQVAWNEAPA
ncbi:Polyamine-transporting ATPase [Gloeomargarita lithophora Alchichica-D10]|uniref:Polyamine-transporting ATPase n=1 Tax=Gloeomargarita lithophora Alchichica-D10 TaxID=1188229 RepID=A0A1J0A8R6_9CYAN|nr:ABC transporter ATP-binding protein [Gloeomargarita lithophora]APB32330.1 Polyamine-transporting ATPase [Gloeomargarita lithophora Alchichica-D10]